MGMTVSASMSMQNMGRNTGVESSAYDRLNRKAQQVENNDKLTQHQKDLELQAIEQQKEQLDQQIKTKDTKQEEKTSKTQLKDKAEELMNIYDAETAKTMLQMEKLMSMATSADSSLDGNTSLETDMTDLTDMTDMPAGTGIDTSVTDQVLQQAQAYDDVTDEMNQQGNKILIREEK